MRIIKRIASFLVLGILLLIVAFDIWGFATLGRITPALDPARDDDANKVVMVFGATGSVGDGLLKAAVEDPDVEKVYVVTRRTSSRIDAGVASGKVDMRLLQDYTDYSSLADILAEVNTVLWGLGTSSLNVDDPTFTRIHVDFPVSFVNAWLAERQNSPMSFHYITGMGTDPEGEEHWAREKGRGEREVAELAASTDLRTFAYRSAFVRPTEEQSNALHYFGETVLRPGGLVITSKELGEAMLEISARSEELPNGTVIDNVDSIRYAHAYKDRRSSSP
jgi:hypothetical protein